MKMRSLFLKIFLWFWATVIAIGVALVLTFMLVPGGVPSGWHAALVDAARFSGAIAVQEAERGGPAAASAYILGAERETKLKSCLFDLSEAPIAGDDCGIFKGMVSGVSPSKMSSFSMRFGIVRVALIMRAESGHRYIYATELPAGPRAALGINHRLILMEWGTALFVSGFICYLLTLHLTRPVLELREAAQQLASGDLNTRAGSRIDRRRDELGDLVRDFNSMAERIEQLISQQRQLIYDVSHELRSPLARLNVALDLGRERKGSDPAFDHMERDLERLNEMIERLLTIAKIDTSSSSIQLETINLVELVSQVSRDAEFESQERSVTVQMTAAEEYVVQADARLLRSAVENVVRNAIHYTAFDSTVEIILGSNGNAKSFVQLLIRDQGPGVPESELVKIFRPFYRLADARDRQSGGTGLGLAIAERIVRIHGGTIRAENISPNGLQLEILLPKGFTPSALRS
jgi:two-component system sensor histidine kinase CpxA